MIPWKTTQLNVLSDYRLDVVFRDGTSGIFDLSDETFDGVFASFADPKFLDQTTSDNGVVVWSRRRGYCPRCDVPGNQGECCMK